MNQPASDHPRPGNDTNPTAGPKPSQDPSTRPRTPSTAHAAPLAGSDPEWLDSYILKRVDYHVRAIRRQYQGNEADSEDVAQMLLLEINRARPKFDPELASWQTFAAGVAERAAATIRRDLQRDRRRQRALRLGRREILRHEQVRRAAAEKLMTRLEERDEYEHIVRLLPARLAETAQAVARHGTDHAPPVLGKHRATMYRCLEQIRACLDERQDGM